MALGSVRIEQDEVGIVVKKFSTRSLPSDQRVALKGEAGPQADTLGPGLHWGYPSWQYTIRKVPLVKIPPGEIGLVIAKDGKPIPPERLLGKVVDCKNFQDARAFLENGGQMGPQLGALVAGVYRINTELFDVITTANAKQHGVNPHSLRIYMVETGKVGIVTTSDGAPLPAREIAGPVIPGHNNFQNGQKFIDGGGCRGMQEEYLSPGAYNLNPWFVKIEQVPFTHIEAGTVGVVISYVGKDPGSDNANALVESGYKGILKDPLYPGDHPINTRVMKVEVVPTHQITLDWSNESKPAYNYDAELNALRLRSKDGFAFDIEVTQVINIAGKDAPRMVSRIGSESKKGLTSVASATPATSRFDSIRNLVTRQLEPLISSHFLHAAQKYEALDFIDKGDEIQNEAFLYIKDALKAAGVQAIGTFIRDIDLPNELERVLQEREFAKQQALTHEAQKVTDVVRQQREMTEAEHRARLQQLKNAVDADAIRQVGNAEADNVKRLVDILEKEGYLASKHIDQLSEINLPTTLIGNHSWLGDLIAYRELGQSKPPRVSQDQIADFVSTLGGYLKEGGAEELRGAITELLTTPSPMQIEAKSKEVLSNSDAKVTAQDLRLDIAAPDKIIVKEVFELAVSVRQVTSSILMIEGLSQIESDNIQVEWPKKYPFIRLRIQVSAPDCLISGDHDQQFRLYKGQDSPVFYFHLTPQREGKVSIVVKVFQEDDWLGNAIIHTTSYQKPVGSIEIIKTIHPIPHPLASVEKQIVSYSYRLQKLREIQSIKGIDTEPHYLMEIEDIERKLEKLELTRSKYPYDFGKVETIPPEATSINIQPVPKNMNVSMWRIAGASVQGTSHIKSGTPCQDAHSYRILDDQTIILAVADGLGSAASAREGSKIAVEKTLASLGQLLHEKPVTEEAWTAAVKESFEKTYVELAAVATAQSLDIREYGTTLIAVVLSDSWLVTGHIGDGAVVALFEDGQMETVSPPLRQEYANQTISITQENALQWAKFSARPAKIKALALLSDGLQPLCLKNTDNKPFAGFFNPIFENLSAISSSTDSSNASQALAEFLASERVCEKTSDDKTLVLVGRKAI